MKSRDKTQRLTLKCASCGGTACLWIWRKTHRRTTEHPCCTACWQQRLQSRHSWNKKTLTVIVVVQDVEEYRATIDVVVREQDSVLEVGCAWGTTTSLIAGRCRDVIGIDKGESLSTARREHPCLRFQQIDAFDIGRVLGLGRRFNKMYLDISGSRKLEDLLPLLRKYESVFAPEVIVVKSNKLKGLLRRCVLWDGATELPEVRED